MWASGEEPDGAFDLPPLDAFPRQGHDAFAPFPTSPSERDMSLDTPASVHSDEFVDAEAFMADHKPGEDSFLREATGGDASASWSDDDMADANDRRASAIFVPKSRNMDKVEFSSPKRTDRKAISVHHEPSRKMNVQNQASNAAFSATNTALSSEYDIHLDNRLVLTPNSFKYLQQRERQPTEDFTLSQGNGSTQNSANVSYTLDAKQVVDANATTINKFPSVPPTPARPSSAEKAMHAGPGVIKKALNEIEAMLRPMSYDDEASDPEFDTDLEKVKSRLREIPQPAGLSDLASKTVYPPEPSTRRQNFREDDTNHELQSDGVQDKRVLKSDASVQVATGGGSQVMDDERPQHARRTRVLGVAREPIALNEKGAMRISSLSPHSDQLPVGKVEDENAAEGSAVENISVVSQSARYVRTVDAWTQPDVKITDPENSFHNKRPARPKEARPETSYRRASLRESVETPLRNGGFPDREDIESNLPAKIPAPHRREHTRPMITRTMNDMGHETASIKATVNSLPLATAVPSQMARRCRRFLCTVGERMSEQIVFSNGSSRVGRICVSLLPLSTGCQQFSVTPAVLELQPRSRSAFTVTFEASRSGVVAGIFQFRAVGVDGLFEPYEVLIEASVRGDIQLAPALPRPASSKRSAPVIKSSHQEDRVTELPAKALAAVKITPTFIRFKKSSNEDGGDTLVGSSSIRITNSTAESVHFQVKSSHEHLQISRARGQLQAGSEVEVQILPICRPFGRNEGPGKDWCGSMTVIVGDVLSREVSIVIGHSALVALPTFDEAARVRQAISAQTDSFYYTKKVNRRGLYFHARAVECGSCVVGETHQVPVYICNGSDAPMTVFLQALQEPFSCEYQTTTLQARKFIEVPVTFRPKAHGKVATCLVAYTVTGKAAVTLIARGIDKAAAPALEQN